MKTAMQELIDKLNNVKPTQYCSIETIRGWSESLLEKEKEQMINAYKEGLFDENFFVNAYKEGLFDKGFFDDKWDEERAKEYYNETYGEQK